MSDWLELFRGSRGAFTAILSLAIGLHAIDVFLITTVMPTVVRDIGGAAFYAWSTLLYIVASIAGAASGGPIKAALGPRKAYALAGLIFLAGSAGCGVSPAMPVLLAARAVQGFGGGLLLAQSMGLIGELFPAELRTRVLAMVSGVWGVAALLGPMVGGVFAALGWWRGAFWIGAAITAAFTAAAWRVLPASARVTATARFPIRRIVLLTVGVLAAGVSGNVDSGLLQLLLFGAAILLVVLTFRLDAAAANRLFPPRPMSLLTTVGTTYWILMLFSMLHTAIGIYMPLALEELHGLPPLAAGYGNTALALSWTLSSFVTAGWRGRAEQAAIVGGPLLALASAALLAWGAATQPPAFSYVLSGLIGFSIGASNLHLVALVMRRAEAGHESLTASSIPTVRSLGISFGAAAAGLIANTAGLGQGISVATVTAATTWVYGAAVAVPAAAFLLSLRVLRLRAAVAAE